MEDLLIRAKHLFVAARTVVSGLRSSRGERDHLGLGQAGQSPKAPVNARIASFARLPEDAAAVA
jgi:hypothetical protein